MHSRGMAAAFCRFCLIGFGGFQGQYLNGFILLHSYTGHHPCVILSTADGRNKILNHFTLSRIIPVHVYHPYRMHTASHCTVSLEHPLCACGKLGIATSREPDFPPKSRHTEFKGYRHRGPGRTIRDGGPRESENRRCRSTRTVRTAAKVSDL